jgi:undecaprenyl phosphate-alpha-L-ara4FN deformylase
MNNQPPITAGLRIDVDTLRGTRLGVPNLVQILDKFGIQATFFFSVGPDNMGRHLWRLLRPAFLVKMMRTKAASLYGWDILCRGTLWPGPIIGEKCADQIRQAADAGHEIGLHAWDHQRWQSKITGMDQKTLSLELARGVEMLAGIIGRFPSCSAAPAWRITPAALAARAEFPFRYNSDCRGHSPFYPLMAGKRFDQPQIPTTLPTYDELIGSMTKEEHYNDYMLKLFKPGSLNVLTIHAEVEGLYCLNLFRGFLVEARQRHISFKPLGAILGNNIPEPAGIINKSIAGREGWVSYQQEKN